MSQSLEIRAARHGDELLLLDLIRELAVYEELADEVEATPDDLAESLFGAGAVAEAVIAEWDGEPVGFALFFRNFSTFVGRPGLYLEDLFVQEPHRGKGIGKALLLHLAGIARARNYGRMEWSVLDWNKPAIDFYHSLGAKPMSEWTVFRLDEKALAGL
ncbi:MULTISPECIES: GNAT family N-acetyltransferase [unclassified Wenzhouxiangella]|uniref:GNAT family N-acetyltransferase n=1 Tax=unclassified Wenzhouxiangella TaxID=2613841 RepID=UPI000E32C853|nr:MULTISPECIES: GNAT family N-acetyltransferase [unclassified Wenzhouxiangella]RFF27727.1 GNAT family N-acetyltransferase [Wenzhouxiangella sp. 15181]RFP69819.1 GNAT family N-acetyltransferase [Wenzhouxiangella sp. 15190]